MDKVKNLTPFLSVSPQISEADVGVLAAQGCKAVINNRPDGEGVRVSRLVRSSKRRHAAWGLSIGISPLSLAV